MQQQIKLNFFKIPKKKTPLISGKFSVGVMDFSLTDENRIEEVDGKNRRISLRAWYPTDKRDGQRMTYFYKKGMSKSMTKQYKVNLLKYLDKLKTNSVIDAPIKKGKYPVVLFSHGHSTHNWDLTTQCESLASYGYTVFSIGHMYEGRFTVFNDEIIGMHSKINEGFKKEFKHLKEIFVGEIDWQSPLAVKHSIYTNERMKTWTDDVKFTIDTLQKFNEDKNSAFYDSLDLDNIGIFGMSFGGANAVRSCHYDDRIKCGANLDGGQFGGDFQTQFVKTPFMIMAGNTDGYIKSGLMEGQGNFYKAQVNGATHLDFTDGSYIYGDLTRKILKANGTIDGIKMQYIMQDTLRGFFDKYLKGNKFDYQSLNSKYKKELNISYVK